jgi:3-oxoacyl-(acyl-carrier-protein) synthase
MIRSLSLLGCGAVSPAGWGLDALVDAVSSGAPLTTSDVPAPAGVPRPHAGRLVPLKKDPLLAHPRLRRAGRISHFAAAASLEALGDRLAEAVKSGSLRLGLVYTLVNGGVVYSRRFFGELLAQPSTASPILFPETVFNAPASHLAAFLGLTGPVTTIVGDTGAFLHGLETASLWLELGLVDACLVTGAEEADWMTAEGLALLEPGAILAEGAGAVLVGSPDPTAPATRLTFPNEGVAATIIADEAAARLSGKGKASVPARVLGHGLGAAHAWQTVLAADAVAKDGSQRVLASVTTTGGKMKSLAVERG